MPWLKSTTWRDFLVVHRLQFPLPINYLCCALWGCGFATGDLARVFDPPALLSIGAGLLVIVGPLALNVAIDMPTDVVHAHKGYLAGAAGRIGRERTLALARAELCAGLLAALAIGFRWQRWWPLVIAAVVVAAQLAYNVEPIRLKRRGFAGPSVFGLASMLPCLLGYTAMAVPIDGAMWVIFAGVTVLAVGRTLWWAIPDRAADSATGIITPAVRHGQAHALGAACFLLVSGVLLLGGGLWRRYGPVWAAAGLAAHAAFLGVVFGQLGRTRQDQPPDARGMLKRTLPVVALGNVALTIIAFCA